MQAHPMICEYIRKRKSGRLERVGIIVGFLEDSNIKIGWSKCNLKEDRFNITKGISIAANRAAGHPDYVQSIPTSINNQLRRFGGRCLRYFKQASTVSLPD